MDIIEALVKYIEDKGLSQAGFAQKIGYNPATINRIINRKIPITKSFGRKFLRSEGLPLDDLLNKNWDNLNRRNSDMIRTKIDNILDIFNNTETGKKYLKQVLDCLENELLNYLSNKRKKHA